MPVCRHLDAAREPTGEVAHKLGCRRAAAVADPPRRGKFRVGIERNPGPKIADRLVPRNLWRGGVFSQMLDNLALAPGDVVITPAVDRLSRDTTDLLVIARDMQRAGAGIRSLAEPFLNTTSDFAEIIFAILGVAAKLERRRILDRMARGRADAKESGVKFGRKPILTPHQQKEARKRLEAGETQRSVARSYNVSQSTISRL
jgi:DNA invertase Pin-like site-specific DNA recombinase